MTRNSQPLRRWLVAVILPLAVAACGESEGPHALDPTEFVDIIVALRHAEQEAEREAHRDSVAIVFERRKAEILERHNATEEDVRAFLHHHRHRPQLVAAVWDSIAQRLRASPPGLEEDTPWIEDRLEGGPVQLWEDLR